MAKKRTLARFLAETLQSAGVERIWGVTGDSLNGVTDTLREMQTIEWMHVRHEEVAAFAAGAEAAVTGQLAVCAASCGPGNLHLINGLFDCHRSRQPVLAIAAHIPSSEIGLSYFQETHPQELFRECSHFVALVTNPAQLPEVLHRAMRSAILQQGVAVVVIPGDIALLEVDKHVSSEWPALRQPRVLPAAEDVQQFAALLQQSKAVTLLCGSGCAGAHDAVVALADTLGAPVVHALRGKEYVEWENPFDVGMTGLIGFSSCYHAMLNCDTLIMLGTDFPYRQFYPKDATIVQVDRDPGALGRRTPLQLGIAADVGETVAALLPQLQRREARGFLEKSLAHYRKAREGLDDLAVPADPGEPLHPQFVTRLISQIADQDAVFTCDVGTPTVWAALLAHERQAPLAGIVQSRLDGQCDATGAGRASGVSWAASHFPVGRWRLCDVDGRFHFAGAIESTGEGRRVQQRIAGFRGDGNEGGRLSGYRHRAAQSGLCGDEQCGGHPRDSRGRVIATGTRIAAGFRTFGSGVGGCAGRHAGAGGAAGDHA